MSYSHWRPFLTSLAGRAGKIMRQNFAFGMNRELKDDHTPVTKTDLAVNALVIDEISKFHPNVRVIGEEKSRFVDEAELTVLVDPVDGTIPFCRGIPVATFVITLLHHSNPVASVIYDPFMERMWSAIKEEGVVLKENGAIATSLQVSTHSTIADAHIEMCWWNGSQFNLHSVAEKLMGRDAGWSNFNSIAYGGALVASGEIEATIFPGTNGWETAAMHLMVEEASGTVTNIHGKPIEYGPNGEITGHIISNGLIHDEIIDIVMSVQ